MIIGLNALVAIGVSYLVLNLTCRLVLVEPLASCVCILIELFFCLLLLLQIPSMLIPLLFIKRKMFHGLFRLSSWLVCSVLCNYVCVWEEEDVVL